MAVAGDFIPSEDADFIDEPINPVIFGIELSPQIIGALIAIFGLGRRRLPICKNGSAGCRNQCDFAHRYCG